MLINKFKTGAIFKIVNLLSREELNRAWLLLFVMIISALLDVVGVVSIMPLMTILANPESIETNPILLIFQKQLNFQDTQKFIYFFAILSFVLLVVSLVFKAFSTYIQLRFALMREQSIGKKLMRAYLCQPYSWFLNKNSAELSKSILSEVSHIISNAVLPLIILISQSIASIAIVVLLFIVDPILALSVSIPLALLYLLIFALLKSYLYSIGINRVEANEARFKVVNESLQGIKQIKLSRVEDVYINVFSKHAKIYAKNQSISLILSQIPKYFLEILTFGGMLLLIIVLMKFYGNFSEVLPVISLYALAAYRLMPALQQIFSSMAKLKFIEPALDLIHEDLKLLELKKISKSNKNHSGIVFEKFIELKDLYFAFMKSDDLVLKNINLTIRKNSMIGFVGTTGSGKTTLIDIILGLLEPKKGSIFIDDAPLNNDNMAQWQKKIGYVPQQVYLADSSIRSNIAFDVEDSEISDKRIEEVSVISNLHDFVKNKLVDGYDTIVGEGGVRLSGGQRQRIAIARSLYNNPDILILDEATSALDNSTEKNVMQSINNMKEKLTIIIIAHRIETLSQCDQIYSIDNGRIIEKGTYSDFIKSV